MPDVTGTYFAYSDVSAPYFSNSSDGTAYDGAGIRAFCDVNCGSSTNYAGLSTFDEDLVFEARFDTVRDTDDDGIPDDEDNCPETPAGAVVNAEGCAIVQLCPCEDAWKNHGAYVRCVTHAAEDFVAAGLITEEEKDAIVSAAARSPCGKKK